MAVRLGANAIAWSNDDMPELGGDTPLETYLTEASEVALRPLAGAGFDGWLILEAEQDPAKSHPFTDLERGYADLRRFEEDVGFRIAPR